MALQLLYSCWRENGKENTIRAASKALSEEDINYIIRHTVTRVDYDSLIEDNENKEFSATFYLYLPSGQVAVARTGCYTVGTSFQKNNVIMHAFIAECDETISPLLYAINNCFKKSLTAQEQEQYALEPILPQTPFPRPQFKLDQVGIKKFFSRGRLKILASLLQAIIDSHQNERKVFFYDKYSSLKYWFYGIHCCLPDNIKQDLTFSTYLFSDPDACKLICCAPQNDIDSNQEIELGHFVIDNLGSATCKDIESTKYANFIVNKFAENSSEALDIAKGIDHIMKTYGLSVSIAAGVMKLLECDFEWFDSAHDIQFFFGKIGFVEKSELERISSALWSALKKPDAKFKLNEQALPLLSYIFKNTNATVRREMFEYINGHLDHFGIYEAMSLKDYYADITDKLGFVYQYLPSAIILHDKFKEYRDYCKNNTRELCILLYIIVDDYDHLSASHGKDAVNQICLDIFLQLLEENTSDFILGFCRKTSVLQEDFVELVIVNGIWKHVQRAEENERYVDEELVFSIMEEIISKPKAAADLLKIFARKGRYSESTLSLYLELCRNYPNETAMIDAFLAENKSFSSFSSDMAVQRFISEPHTTDEELAHFFHTQYLKGSDRDLFFESKIKSYLDSLLPVRQIEVADRFLRLLVKHSSNIRSSRMIGELASYIVNQSINDIYDYYSNCVLPKQSIADLLQSLELPLTKEFTIACLCVELKDVLTPEKERNFTKSSKEDLFLRLYALSPLEDIPSLNEENKSFLFNFFRYVLRYLVEFSRKNRKTIETYRVMLQNFLLRAEFETVLTSFVLSYEDKKDLALYDAIIAPILLSKLKEDLVSDCVFQTCTSTLMIRSLRERKMLFKAVLSCCDSEEDTLRMKIFLTALYYSDLSWLKKVIATSPKKLFY